MLERRDYRRMFEWKMSRSKTALLVTGARQIGKTFLVRQFARENYESVVEFNFILDPDAASIFTRPLSTSDIMMRISLLSQSELIPGNTLIFLDEIQQAPEALTAIKGLVDASEYDFVLSGSLLGAELRGIRSNPVGYVTTLHMHPLDFEEFCWANGVSAQILSYLGTCMADKTPVDGPVHDRMMNLFRQYLVVGGMPDAVQAFVDSGNISEVRRIQESVKNWYRDDISKYCPVSERLRVRDAFDLVPSELSNPNKRFILKELNQNARFRTYEEAFLWLAHADVALGAFNVSEPTAPLLISKERNLFKLFYSDVGLLTSSFSNKTALSVLDGAGDGNYGGIYENAVAQELNTHGFDLYYHNSKKHGELDFVVETRDGEVIPIEVKSGKAYKRHRALSNILDVANYRFERAYVFGTGNIEREEIVLILPIYLTGLLRNE